MLRVYIELANIEGGRRMAERTKLANGGVPVVGTRAEAMRLATASAAMEGVPMSPEAQRLMALWAEGQMTDDELVAAVREHALQAAGPERPRV
jgi:hypothetical protein